MIEHLQGNIRYGGPDTVSYIFKTKCTLNGIGTCAIETGGNEISVLYRVEIKRYGQIIYRTKFNNYFGKFNTLNLNFNIQPNDELVFTVLQGSTTYFDAHFYLYTNDDLPPEDTPPTPTMLHTHSTSTKNIKLEVGPEYTNFYLQSIHVKNLSTTTNANYTISFKYGASLLNIYSTDFTLSPLEKRNFIFDRYKLPQYIEIKVVATEYSEVDILGWVE